jgi:hypothetical protein
VDLMELGLGSNTYSAFDVATGVAQYVAEEFRVDLPARSFRLIVLRRDPGVIWTDSVLSTAIPDAAGLTTTARGPAAVPGFLHVVVPTPRTVLLDRTPLGRATSPQTDVAYSYDDASGVLSLAYSHATQRRIEVQW